MGRFEALLSQLPPTTTKERKEVVLDERTIVASQATVFLFSGLLNTSFRLQESPRSHHMATEAALLAVIRASRPQFRWLSSLRSVIQRPSGLRCLPMTLAQDMCRCRHDKLAFAVHAFLLAQDYKLIAAGQAAEDENRGKRPVSGLSSTASPIWGALYSCLRTN